MTEWVSGDRARLSSARRHIMSVSVATANSPLVTACACSFRGSLLVHIDMWLHENGTLAFIAHLQVILLCAWSLIYVAGNSENV